MADPITFAGVEEQDLIRLGDGLVAPQVPHVGAAIGKDELGGSGMLLRARVPAAALTAHIPNRDGRSGQERLNGEFGLEVVHVGPRSTAALPW
jgi:hypothetical protein